jgi:hypothetical protein
MLDGIAARMTAHSSASRVRLARTSDLFGVVQARM